MEARSCIRDSLSRCRGSLAVGAGLQSIVLGEASLQGAGISYCGFLGRVPQATMRLRLRRVRREGVTQWGSAPGGWTWGGSARRGLRRDAAATFWVCAVAAVMPRPAHKVAEPSRLWLRSGRIGPGGSARRGLRRDAAATFWVCAAAAVMPRPAHKVAEPSRLWLRTGWLGPVESGASAVKERTLTKRQTELSADSVSSPLWTAHRVGIAVLVVSLLVLAGLFGVSVFRDAGPITPTFRRLTAADIQDGYTFLGYDYSTRESIHGDGLWFFLIDTNMGIEEYWGTYLFDLTTGSVVGEVVDGVGAVYDAETSTVLCYRVESGNSLAVQSLSRGFLDLAKMPSRSLFKLMGITAPSWLSASSSGSGLERSDFWVLDLKTDQATYLGHMMKPPRNLFHFKPSPDGRWTLIPDTGYARTISANDLVEMDSGVMRPFPAPGRPIGWWEDHSVLTWSHAEGIRLVDVETGTHTLLIGTAEVTSLLNHVGIADLDNLYPFLWWNGGGYDLYFADFYQFSIAGVSYLVKYHRVDGRLELLFQNFQFEWSHSLDREGRYYVFSGREQGAGSDGVFRRDLRTGEERTLVAPTPTGSRGSSIPVLRDERVIYRRTNELWSVSIDGTDRERLFPPD
jgi:hypothetical protein